MVLLSDGADNSGGIDLETISEIRRQRIPVHTIGFGKEKMAHDLEITDVQVAAARAAGFAPGGHGHLSSARLRRTEGQDQREGRHEDPCRRRRSRSKADGVEQVEQVLFNAGPAGVKTIETSVDPLPGEENIAQ